MTKLSTSSALGLIPDEMRRLKALEDENARQKKIVTDLTLDRGMLQDVIRDLDLWAYVNDVTLDFSRPGKPTDNAYIGSFNGKFRAECLNQHWFLTLDDARQKMEEWRRDYNEVRPHSAIGNKPPITLMNTSGASGPP